MSQETEKISALIGFQIILRQLSKSYLFTLFKRAALLSKSPNLHF
ncbi:hypothetical protein STRDD11_01436 [Streptococcus sp. DD11]|nr:hypothetical protein STRDD11_01436 [Streptococcus sp. DD11]